MIQNNEPNKCLKCQKEIEPEYYYCDKCADRRMKWQFALTILISAVILFVFSAVYNLLKPSIDELIYMIFASSPSSEGALLCGLISGAYTLIHYAIAFAIIRFTWNKFKYADSELRDVPKSEKPKVLITAEPKTLFYTVGHDVSAGKHSVVSTKAEGGFIYIKSSDNTLLDKIYVKDKKKIKLKPQTTVKAINCIIESCVLENSNDNQNKICFCRKCGEKLIDNSKFCRKCGTEIVIVEED